MQEASTHIFGRSYALTLIHLKTLNAVSSKLSHRIARWICLMRKEVRLFFMVRFVFFHMLIMHSAVPCSLFPIASVHTKTRKGTS